MAGKFVGLFSRQVALAAVGALLVAGGVSTVAFAAQSQGPAPMALFSSVHSNANHGHGKNDPKDPNGPQGHTPGDPPEIVPVQGTLTAYDATHSTITVTGKAEDNDNHGKDSHDTDGTNGNTSACTLTSPFTISLDAKTRINEQALSASGLANEIGHKVEVQAEEQANCSLLAKKVTVAAADASTKHGTYVGTVGTVGTSSFTLDPKHGTALTIDVSPTTTFGGHVHQLSDLKSGMHVVVHGTPASANTVQASHIEATGHGHMH